MLIIIFLLIIHICLNWYVLKYLNIKLFYLHSNLLIFVIKILGIEPCLSRVNVLIKEALGKADLNNNIKLKGLVCIEL